MDNPVTLDVLRDDWADDPDLSEEDAKFLLSLPDDVGERALDTAFRNYEDGWFAILDSVREDVTRALLQARKEEVRA